MVPNKEISGVTFRFFLWDNKGREVPLSKMPCTAVKREEDEA